MAAYAALVSLINIMEQIKVHPRLSIFLDPKHIDGVLRENVDILLNFIENHTSHGSIEAEVLEREIVAAAQAAEDIFESHIVDLINDGFTEKTPSLQFDLQKLKEGMDFIKEKVIKVEEERGFRHKRSKVSEPSALISRTHATGNTTMVGFDGYLSQLMDRLTALQSDRQLIPIVGMGGIGKTTLARNVYESSIVLHYFHVRAWVTISQAYNVREVLLETLSCLEGSTSGMDQRTEHEIAEQLYKFLSGRRYLVVLDDMWSIEAWNRIKFFFPENHNGSRIVVTTREKEVAEYFGSMALFLNLLDESKSWELLCKKAFVQEILPPEVEKIGKSIAKLCNGLPLSIVVISGFLGRSSEMQEYWDNEEEYVTSILSSIKGDHCFDMLYLSYNYLPAHLKPCLLYLGIFREDHLIRVSKLIKLWVAEGFIKPHKHQTMEEVAKGYLNDLVGRNLVLVHSFGFNGKPKFVHIHDLVRDLCLKIGEKEKFFCVVRAFHNTPQLQDIDSERRIVIHESIVEEESNSPQVFHLKSTAHARSIIYRSYCLSSFKSRLLRVLSNAHGDSIETVFEQVNLRHLEYHQNGWISFKIPSSITLFWNLQTIIVTGRVSEVVAPSEIWEMPQLRHLKLYWHVRLPVPAPAPSGQQDFVVLQNLQTLQDVLDFRCSEEMCKRMPNIRKLKVTFHEDLGDVNTMSSHCLYNVGLLTKLESLKYFFVGDTNRDGFVQNLKFPNSLKKLILEGCKLFWEDLTMIGSLPNLEYLKLEYSVFGPEWNPVEGEFLRLRYLEILCCLDLTCWNAERCHFPVLEELVLVRLWKLEEIPLDMGEISTLRDVYVYECSVSAAVSAVKILEEQEGFGNDDLRVRVKLYEEKPEDFREKLEIEGLTTENFQLIDA
ncbi:hypothetical protein C2S51_018648 [Perilla frutescens var. frutescens]|nr:hypothetical protein C2S51_018648 [Perilla frutescens var. frutescens]